MKKGWRRPDVDGFALGVVNLSLERLQAHYKQLVRPICYLNG